MKVENIGIEVHSMSALGYAKMYNIDPESLNDSYCKMIVIKSTEEPKNENHVKLPDGSRAYSLYDNWIFVDSIKEEIKLAYNLGVKEGIESEKSLHAIEKGGMHGIQKNTILQDIKKLELNEMTKIKHIRDIPDVLKQGVWYAKNWKAEEAFFIITNNLVDVVINTSSMKGCDFSSKKGLENYLKSILWDTQDCNDMEYMELYWVPVKFIIPSVGTITYQFPNMIHNFYDDGSMEEFYCYDENEFQCERTEEDVKECGSCPFYGYSSRELSCMDVPVPNKQLLGLP
jgi:hypothetical protein